MKNFDNKVNNTGYRITSEPRFVSHEPGKIVPSCLVSSKKQKNDFRKSFGFYKDIKQDMRERGSLFELTAGGRNEYRAPVGRQAGPTRSSLSAGKETHTI